MKREGNLIAKAAEPENLRLAFYLARRGKRCKVEVLNYERQLDHHLLELRRQILEGHAECGNYHYFLIYEPKKRLISAAPFAQRVLHHALINVCYERFERHLIDFTYACRKDMGTFCALEQAQEHSRRYGWFLKMDVRKYFDSIDHKRLRIKLARLFREYRILSLFDDIIASYEVQPGRGLPIGNLTSQYFANYYLSAADHYMKEQLGAKAYVRYMDDMIVWGDSATELNRIATAFSRFIEEEGLFLKPLVVNRTQHGLPFLGFLVYPWGIRLGSQSRRRFAGKLRIYLNAVEAGQMEESEFSRRVLALYGYIGHCRSRGFASSVIRRYSSAGIGSNRLARGGSWNNNASNCTVANRNSATPANCNNNLGFRVAFSSKQRWIPCYEQPAVNCSCAVALKRD